MAEKRTTGYGRRWRKWLAIYLFAGAVVYLIVYLVFFADGCGAAGPYWRDRQHMTRCAASVT
jgi:hypothetical protein